MEIVIKHQNVADPMVGFTYNGPKIINALLCSFSKRREKRSVLEIVNFKEYTYGLPEDDIKRYKKWYDILSELMDQKYGEDLEKSYGKKAKNIQINKMAKLEAGNMLPIFTETEMYHLMTKEQISCLLGLMKDYIKRAENDVKAVKQAEIPMGCTTDEEYKALLAQKLSELFKEFEETCQENNLIDQKPSSPEIIPPFQFGENLRGVNEVFKNNYSVRYNGSFLQLMQRLGNGQKGLSFEYIGPQDTITLPRILAFEDLDSLQMNWQEDMINGQRKFLQGQKIVIMENQSVDWLLKQKAKPIALAIPSETISQMAKTKGKIGTYTRDDELKLLLTRHFIDDKNRK